MTCAADANRCGQTCNSGSYYRHVQDRLSAGMLTIYHVAVKCAS